MRESLALIAGLAAFLAPINIQAESPNACLSITDKDTRLSCYDRALGYAPQPIRAAEGARIDQPCAADFYPKPKSCELKWGAVFSSWRAHCERVVYDAIDQPIMPPEDLDRVRCMVDNTADVGNFRPPLVLRISRSHSSLFSGGSEVFESLGFDQFESACSGRVNIAIDNRVVKESYPQNDRLDALLSGRETAVDIGGSWPECRRGRANYDLTGFREAVEAARAKFREYDTP